MNNTEASSSLLTWKNKFIVMKGFTLASKLYVFDSICHINKLYLCFVDVFFLLVNFLTAYGIFLKFLKLYWCC